MINTIESALKSANINGHSLSFPIEIDTGTYTKVKKMLTDIRGTWKGGKISAFMFDFKPSNIINTFLDTGLWPKKNPFALFPTPASIIDYALEYTFAGATRWHGYKVVRILEPSAGRGDFIDAVVNDFNAQGIPVEVTCVEIDDVNVEILKDKQYKVIAGDFLTMTKEILGEFDLIISNPPFQSENFIKHVNHAQSFLQVHGKLMAVMPTTLFTSTTKAALELQPKIAALNIGEFGDCVFPSGTFDNTSVETMIAVLNSPERTLSDMKDIEGYATQLIGIALSNEQEPNNKINQCKSPEDMANLMPYLIKQYKELSPYAFVNDNILLAAQSMMYSTIEKDDEKIIEQTPVTEEVESMTNPVVTTEKIDTLLKDISKAITTPNADKNKIKKNVSQLNAKRRPVNTVNETQLELVFCA